MDHEYISAKLSLLPQFEVTSIDYQMSDEGRVSLLRGYAPLSMGMEAQSANLFLGDLRYVDGRMLASDGPDTYRTVSASVYAWADIGEVEVLGKSLACFGGYDTWDLTLVIDPVIHWATSHFESSKAIQTRITGTDGKAYLKIRPYIEDEVLAEGESLVDDGWNHEHCRFCTRGIYVGDRGHRSLSTDLEGRWVCGWCYAHAVQKRDPRPLLVPYAERL